MKAAALFRSVQFVFFASLGTFEAADNTNSTSVLTDSTEAVPSGNASTSDSAPTQPEVCKDTPGWVNGYTACNNYVPVDPDCTKDGAVCHFYKVHPHFCVTGLRDPWLHCCTCGGGSTFNGKRPTTPPPSEVHVPGEGWLPGAHTLSLELGKFKKKLAPVEKGLHEVYKGLNQPDYDAPPVLEGNALGTINLVVLGIIALVAGSSGLAWLLCRKQQPEMSQQLEVQTGTDAGDAADESKEGLLAWVTGRKSQVKASTRSDFSKNLSVSENKAVDSRPAAWSWALLVTSYALLVPGLTQVIFSFNILVNVLGHRIEVQPEKGHASCTETITGLVDLLERTGSRTGAVLIVLYAVVVPAVKLVLLAMGEALRYCNSYLGICLSRGCIIIVQTISKWACPDMFAYILLVHLVRVLEHRPILLTAAKLDIGFSCFSVFCVCSTVSSLGIRLPPLPESDGDGAGSRTPLVLRCLGQEGLYRFVCLLAACFSVLFAVGLFMPCMALRIDERQLYPPVGSVPYSAKPIVESLAIPELLKSDVSIVSCTLSLIAEIGSGEANSIFALIMFGCCVIVLTFADVVLLVFAARRLRSQPLSPLSNGSVPASSSSLTPGPCPYMAWARVCRKLAMLDVSIMGVYVITLCLAIYKKQGLIVSTRNGLLVLIAAEIVHTITYWIVSAAVDDVNPAEPRQLGYKVADAADEDLDAENPERSDPLCCGVGGRRFGVLGMLLPAGREVTPDDFRRPADLG